MSGLNALVRASSVVALALLAIGCDLVTGPPDPTALQPRTFEASIAMPEWRGPLPLGLIDRTGLVSAVAAADPAAQEGVSRTPDGSGLRYVWVGGACDARVALNLRPTSNGYELTNHTEVTGETCDSLALVHQINVHLAQPIDPATVTITFVP